MRHSKYFILLILLCFPFLSAGQNYYMYGGGAGCLALYGSELHVDNSADKPNISDIDATTGWTSVGLSVFDSVDTEPQLGTYHMSVVADSDADRAYYDLSSILSIGVMYKISIYAQNDGSGGNWGCKLYSSNIGGQNGLYNVAWALSTGVSDYTNYTAYFIYDSPFRYLIYYENSAANNGGVYYDNMTILQASLCYGSELHGNFNAADTSDTNATTGWSSIETGVIESDNVSVHNGTYSIKISCDVSLGANDGGVIDIGGALSGGALSNGVKYFISYWVSGDGANTWKIQHGSSVTNSNGLYINQTTATWTQYAYSFVYSTDYRYLTFTENNVGNTGFVNVDGLSVKEIVGE